MNYHTLHINRSIVQGSGLGPTFYIILESDLKPKSDRINKIFKYADDTNLLVPELTDVQLSDEFRAIQEWAVTNKMIVNLQKTKEIVLSGPIRTLLLFSVYPLLMELSKYSWFYLGLLSNII